MLEQQLSFAKEKAMDVLISGSLGTASFIHGESVEIEWVDGRRREASLTFMQNMHRGVHDLVCLKGPSRDDAIATLNLHWKKDKALLFALAALDSDTSDSSRAQVISTLDGWLKDSQIQGYVKSVLFSRPLPKGSVVNPSLLSGKSISEKLLKSVFDSQSKIQAVRSAWDEISERFSSDLALQFEQNLVALGAFDRLVLSNRKDLTALKFECIKRLSGFPSYREIIADLLDPFISVAEVTETPRRQDFVEPLADEPVDFHGPKPVVVPVHKLFTNVQNSLRIIAGYFGSGEFDKGDSLVERLVQEQLSRGERSFAAKTLCSVSEYAKREENYQYQLKYALRANEVDPTDPRVLVHVGDAYFNLDDFESAQKWFDRSVNENGDDFGRRGLVKILVKNHMYEAAYDLLMESFASGNPGLDAWLQRASILRELGNYVEAIEVYSIASGKYPESHYPMCGLAATYALNGQYFQALQAYDQALTFFPKCSVPYTGKGHLLARLGDIENALPLLYRGIELAEDKLIPTTALASALRMHGRGVKALQALEVEREAGLHEEEYWASLIESAIYCGKYSKASSWLEQAESYIGRTPKLGMLTARLLSATGKLKEALVIINEALDRSPRFIEAGVEKSRVLRRLDRVDLATQEVQRLLGVDRRNAYVQMEAMLLGLAEIPLSIVEKSRLKTDLISYEDWGLDHACAVALLEKQDPKNAWRLSVSGRRRSPFKSLRKKFGLALAVARDMLGRVGSVFGALRGSSGSGILAMRAIAYWRLGLQKRLSFVLREIRKCASFPDAIDADAFWRLVSEDYDAEKHKVPLATFERGLLLRLA